MAGVLCLGMAVWDRIMPVGAIPQAPIKTYARDLIETGSGPAATAAVTVARLGGTARLAGRVGDDADGQRIVAELAGFGVETALLRRLPGARSATCTVALDPAGERLILAFPGAGLQVAPDWMDWDAAFAGIGCLLVDMGWPPGAAEALFQAKARGVPSVLAAELNPEAQALIGMADHVLFSAPALALLTEEEDVATALAKVVARRGYHGSVGVMLGERGSCWLDEAGLHHAPGFAVTAVDTLGAGDVFQGAFALALAEDAEPAAAMRFANAVAALKCTRPGGRTGIPDRAEVEAFLRASPPA